MIRSLVTHLTRHFGHARIFHLVLPATANGLVPGIAPLSIVLDHRLLHRVQLIAPLVQLLQGRQLFGHPNAFPARLPAEYLLHRTQTMRRIEGRCQAYRRDDREHGYSHQPAEGRRHIYGNTTTLLGQAPINIAIISDFV